LLRIIEASEAIKKQTNGLVDLQVYPNSQLGSEPDMFSQTRSGALDFMSTSGVNQTVVLTGGINAVAFAFESYDQVWSAMDGDLGNHVRGLFGKVGLHVLPKCLDNGYRTSPQARSRSSHLTISRASRSACRAIHCGSACSRRSVLRRPRSISANSMPRCRLMWSTARRIRWR